MSLLPADRIRVVDDAYPLDLFERVTAFLMDQPYRWGWYSSPTEPIRYWNHTFFDNRSHNSEHHRALSDFPLIEELFNHLLPHAPTGARPLRCYSNLMTYGQDGGVHRDSRDDNDYTILVYMNRSWDAAYAGETCFLDETRDTIRAVLPKPRRVVIFPATMLHVARGIFPQTPFPRVILVFKTTTRSSGET